MKPTFPPLLLRKGLRFIHRRKIYGRLGKRERILTWTTRDPTCHLPTLGSGSMSALPPPPPPCLVVAKKPTDTGRFSILPIG